MNSQLQETQQAALQRIKQSQPSSSSRWHPPVPASSDDQAHQGETGPHVRDWWSSTGTGWGPNHDRPNPFVIAAKQMATDARETVMDVQDEPQEVGYRIRERLKSYMPR